jgi:hypothetical protein
MTEPRENSGKRQFRARGRLESGHAGSVASREILNGVAQIDQHRMLDQVKSGFCQRRFRKRAKSPSVEQSINPCSIASDAR